MKIGLRVSLFFLLVTTCLAFPGCNTTKCIEKPAEDCICTMDYNPVCGCNNKTYSNACEAECHGITEYKPGECPSK